MSEQILTLKRELCPGKHNCKAVKNCPVGALSQKPSEAPTIDHEKCILCGKCVPLCRKKVYVIE